MVYDWRKQEAQSRRDRLKLIVSMQARQKQLLEKSPRSDVEQSELDELSLKIPILLERQNEPYTSNRNRRTLRFRTLGAW